MESVTYPKPCARQVDRWNHLLSLAAELCRVPAALVMQLGDAEIQVAASAEIGQTPYKVGDKETLNIGLYCEHVMQSRGMLCVPNAITDPAWSTNPDIKLGMISYLGYPVLWPDGKVFGTICILDRVENNYSETVKRLMLVFQGMVQDQLALSFEKLRLEEALEQVRTNRDQLTEAVRIAIEQFVNKTDIMDARAWDFANMLDELAGSLATISELPEHQQIQLEISKIVDEINEASERLLKSQTQK